jgi:superfamily II DNA/RNA helicase
MKFTDLSLPPELIAALANQQISDPSPIQIATIPPLAAGKDAYLRAATDRQIDKPKAKPHIVVGSPGRIVDLIERGKLKTAHIHAVVIDEADRLLNEESLNWIQKIVSAAAPARTCSCIATMLRKRSPRS